MLIDWQDLEFNIRVIRVWRKKTCWTGHEKSWWLLTSWSQWINCRSVQTRLMTCFLFIYWNRKKVLITIFWRNLSSFIIFTHSANFHSFFPILVITWKNLCVDLLSFLPYKKIYILLLSLLLNEIVFMAHSLMERKKIIIPSLQLPSLITINHLIILRDTQKILL